MSVHILPGIGMDSGRVTTTRTLTSKLCRFTASQASIKEQRPAFVHSIHNLFLEWARNPQKRNVLPRTRAKQEKSRNFHPPRPPEPQQQSSPPLQKPGQSPSQKSHKRSSMRSWTTLPPIAPSGSSEHALSCPNHGSLRAGDTFSTLPSSLRGVYRDGSGCSRSRRRVLPTTSRNYASGSPDKTGFLSGFSNTPGGLRTRRECVYWDMGGLRRC